MAPGKMLASLLRKASMSSKLRRSSSSASSCSGSISSWSSDCSSDYEDDFHCSTPPAPADVPEGCFAVYVGSQRFVVKMRHLQHPLLKALLNRSAEEYGFDQVGALCIPCDAIFFEHVLSLLNNKDSKANKLEIDELLSFYSS